MIVSVTRLSVTRLIGPPQIRILERLHQDELTEDASDRIWALVGQIGHGILERAETSAITERRLFADLEGWRIPGSPWVFCRMNGERVRKIAAGFERACQRAGIEDFRFHDLRHTCAAWLVQAGVPLTQVRDVLGRSTVVMTERYAHLAPENVRAAVSLLDNPETTRSRSGHAGSEPQKAAIL